ncbi:hypothetical protein [Cohnella sp.]|uniref:hypothetical protein n=1 Tax=Cohnella sp. TaxID=1883426 RepID=UPI0035618180
MGTTELIMQRVYPGLSFDTAYRNLRLLLLDMDVVEQIVFEDGVKFKRYCGDCREAASGSVPEAR